MILKVQWPLLTISSYITSRICNRKVPDCEEKYFDSLSLDSAIQYLLSLYYLLTLTIPETLPRMASFRSRNNPAMVLMVLIYFKCIHCWLTYYGLVASCSGYKGLSMSLCLSVSVSHLISLYASISPLSLSFISFLATLQHGVLAPGIRLEP